MNRPEINPQNQTSNLVKQNIENLVIKAKLIMII